MDFVAVIIQPLEALYQLRRGRGLSPAVEAIFRMAPVPGLFHQWHKMAGHQEHRFRVDREDPVKLGLVNILHRRRQMGDARIVDQNVHRARVRGKPGDIPVAGHVNRMGAGRAADIARNCGCLFAVQIGHDDACAFQRQSAARWPRQIPMPRR